MAVVAVAMACASAGGQTFQLAGQAVNAQGVSSPAAVGDVDGDGLADLLFVGPGGAVRILLTASSATGSQLLGGVTVATTASFGAGHAAVGGQIIGLNGDAFMDLFVVTATGAAPPVLHAWGFAGNGDGTFQAPVNIPVPAGASQVECLDLDYDGRADVLAVVPSQTSFGPGLGFAMLQNVWPNWTSAGYAVVVPAYRAFTGRFDGSQQGSVAWFRTPGQPHGLSWMPLSTTGGFGSIVTVPLNAAPAFPITAVVGDANGDGRDDLLYVASTGGSGSEVAIMTSTGSGFTGPTSAGIGAALPSTPIALALANLDTSALEDIVTVHAVTRCTPSGGCAPAVRALAHPSGNNGSYLPTATLVTELPGALALGLFRDFDQDGDADLIAVDAIGVISRFENVTLFGVGCPGASGVPLLGMGDTQVGAPAYGIQIGAIPNTAAVLAVSRGRITAYACSVLVDMSPGQLILPAGSAGLIPLGASGTQTITLALPNDPALAGTYYAQLGVLDPTGGFSAAGLALALSAGRTFVVR